MPREGHYLIEGVETDRIYPEDDSAATNEFGIPTRFSSDSNTRSSTYSTDDNFITDLNIITNITNNTNNTNTNTNNDDLNDGLLRDNESFHSVVNKERRRQPYYSFRRRQTKGSHSVHSRSKIGHLPATVLSYKRKKKIIKEEMNPLIPLAWLLQQTVGGMIDAIKFWLVHKIAMNLLQLSLTGDKRKQVFRQATTLNNCSSPINIKALDSNHRHHRQQLLQGSVSDQLTPQETKRPALNAPITEITPKELSVSEIKLGEEKKLSDTDQSNSLLGTQENSQVLHWAVVTIECLAVIPIIIIGLCLFYILAVGLFNDIQELLQRFFGSKPPLIPDINESVPLCPYNPVV